MTTQQLKLTQIKANQWNCNYLGPKETQALKQHMQKDGPEKTLPLVVRKTQNNTNQNDEDNQQQQQEQYYEIVDGEHRWAIARELGWETINVIERDVDDQQSKSLCITYNRIRGRLNWIKLYDIIKKDQTTGINITQAYGDALSDKEIEWLLALDNLIPQARTVLEEALKKHPEYTLEQLYMLSLFPPTQQESLMEKFKTPLILQSLKQILTPFLQQQPPPQQNTQLEKLLTSNKNLFANNPHRLSKN
ncbi:MAG: ParB/RepB/Spo0J family partition protein [Candidatus Bathyarchaeota archaeon]|uniref:ParB/RepB/Spo0J family partition protein n=1 Tax=Candidatus Bathycorpusculum sp. TaxID=2994959 RepID=UPI0028301EDE|nr:ParB/RepB/Spo0J family partition protein [Candidatus Termiticorpusculum sp.]MCL2292790.1 ParB/RepB/Spo0J family partition protein [Candidatus Termiticorpusculum sp.]